MTTMTRRDCMLGAAGLATASWMTGERAAAQQPEIPPEGIGQGLRHLSYSDIGGRPDSVQVMFNRDHIYVGHMFSNGVTVLDASDPRSLNPVSFFTAGGQTRTHHLQVADDLLLLANGANIVAMQSYDDMRSYFENSLADSITDPQAFRSGLSIHDISNPAEMREIAFLEMPGFGINRLWWPGGRYAYIAAHFDGFTDAILAIVDLNDITNPEIVSQWWMPGMNRAAGETPTLGEGRRLALHHMLTAGDRGYAAWRDGGLTIHDISDPANPTLISAINWSPPFPAARTRPCRCPIATSSSSPTRPTPRTARRAPSTRSSSTCARRRTPCRSRRCRRRPNATSARSAPSARTTCTRTGRAACRATRPSSRRTTTRACACSISVTRSRRGRSPGGCRRLPTA